MSAVAQLNPGINKLAAMIAFGTDVQELGLPIHLCDNLYPPLVDTIEQL